MGWEGMGSSQFSQLISRKPKDKFTVVK